MDHFFKGFLRQRSRRGGTIARLVRLGAKVTTIENSSERVVIGYEESGRTRTLVADFAVSTIPMPIFKTLKTNLPLAFMQAAARLPMTSAGKIAFQAERFWETRDQIYGGISWTTDPITQIWYPSSGFLSKTGVLTGAYYYGPNADGFNAQPVAERIRMAKEQGERLHDGYSRMVEHGVAIGWNLMEFVRMGWAAGHDPEFAESARSLSQPQGRLHLAGDQITFWSGWQEGALLSAHAAVKAIQQQAQELPARRG
jgi:monoamine oxidase